MSDIKNKIARELAICEKATDGPWHMDDEHRLFGIFVNYGFGESDLVVESVHADGCYDGCKEQEGGIRDRPNAEFITRSQFIARTRTGYPAALRAIEGVLEWCDKTEAVGLGNTARYIRTIISRALEGVE
jgi:hypothetical protein